MKQEKRAKVLVCIDNEAGYASLVYLLSRPSVEVIAAIVHPEHNAMLLDKITTLCASEGIKVFDIKVAREHFDALMVPLAPDFIVSIYFDYILDDRFIRLLTQTSINLHPGYLPYNKGFYYYAWAVLDGTPAGVSIHQIVSEVDAGPIISQKRVLVDATDTGDIIYKKHTDTSIELFQATWPGVENGTYKTFPQTHRGTRKKITETNSAMEIDPYATYRARDLLDTLRVFSFPGHGGCVIDIDGKKYSIGIQFSEVADNVNRPMGKKDNYLV